MSNAVSIGDGLVVDIGLSASLVLSTLPSPTCAAVTLCGLDVELMCDCMLAFAGSLPSRAVCRSVWLLSVPVMLPHVPPLLIAAVFIHLDVASSYDNTWLAVGAVITTSVSDAIVELPDPPVTSPNYH
jgi:hypothetical protein